jgi:hypothetical protein
MGADPLQCQFYTLEALLMSNISKILTVEAFSLTMKEIVLDCFSPERDRLAIKPTDE